MVITWTEAGLNYYLLGFLLKYLPGDIFTNNYTSSSAEIASYLTSGILVKFLNIRMTLWLSHILSFVGMVLLVTIQPNEHQQVLISIFILCGKFGVSSAFNVAYIGTYQLFPVGIVGTCFGVCNLFARAASIFASYIAELKPEQKSEWIFCSLCIIAFLAAFFLVLPGTLVAHRMSTYLSQN